MDLKIDYPKNFVTDLLAKQLSFFLIEDAEMLKIEKILEEVLERLEYCFRFSSNKYYKKQGETYFNPFHSGQWTIFLYYLSNSLYKSNDLNAATCDKIYYLNKMMNGCDLFYETNLPAIFMLDHPLGSVMGRADYGDYFKFIQGCTVGNNKNLYPKIGKHVTMMADSKIIGNTIVGDNVTFAANSFVKDEIIVSNSIVFGSSPHLIIKPI